VQLRPDPRGTAVVALLGVLGLGLAVVADTGGRLLVLPAAVAALLYAARDAIAGPVLSADAEGLELVTGWRRLRVPWSSVERLRVVTDRRTRLVEVDLGSTVVALSGTRLGRDPRDVLEDLLRIRDGGGDAPAAGRAPADDEPDEGGRA
jgi:hypothetical protein